MRRRFFRIALGLAGLHAMAVGAHAQTAVQPAVPCALEYAPLTLGAPVAEGSADDLPTLAAQLAHLCALAPMGGLVEGLKRLPAKRAGEPCALVKRQLDDGRAPTMDQLQCTAALSDHTRALWETCLAMRPNVEVPALSALDKWRAFAKASASVRAQWLQEAESWRAALQASIQASLDAYNKKLAELQLKGVAESALGELQGEIAEHESGVRILADLKEEVDKTLKENGPPEPAPAISRDWQSFVLTGLAKMMLDRAKTEVADQLRERLREACALRVHKGLQVRAFAPALCAVFGVEGARFELSLMGLGRSLKSAALADLERLPDYLLWRWWLERWAESEGHTAAAHEARRAMGVLLFARVTNAFARAVLAGASPIEALAGLESLPAGLGCGTGDGPAARIADALRAVGKLARRLRPWLRAGGELPTYAVTASLVRLRIDFASSNEQEVSRLFDMARALLNEARELAATAGTAQGRIEAMSAGKLRGTPHEVSMNQERTGLGNSDIALASCGRAHAEWASLGRAFMRAAERLLGLASARLEDNEKSALAAHSHTLAQVREVGERLLGGDSAAAMRALLMLEPLRKLMPDAATRLMSLATELGGATSADEVAKIIDSAAAPAGGYKQKFARSLWSLTGFVGYGLYADRATVGSTTAAAGYPAAMLGVEWSAPLARWLRLGAFFSVLDLGTFFRWGQSAGPRVDESATPTFAQVFAPGAWLTLGLAKTPLVLGVGASVVPGLLGVRGGDDRTSVLRFGAFLGVDLTLWPF